MESMTNGDMLYDDVRETRAESPPIEEHAASMPPLSHAELLDRSDLVGRAHVVSIRKIPGSTGRIASLRFKNLIKGTPIFGSRTTALLPWKRTVLVRTRSAKRGADGLPLPGEWSDAYRVGDMVVTHLAWNEETQLYSTVWWNAVWLAPRDR